MLTDKGKQVLGINERESDRHGGPEHRYWAKVIADHLRANGYRISEEAPIGGGKAIDIVATRDGHRIAFEVETGKSNALANVRKCLDAGMDRVVVVATSASACEKLRSVLDVGSAVELVTGSEALGKKDW